MRKYTESGLEIVSKEVLQRQQKQKMNNLSSSEGRNKIISVGEKASKGRDLKDLSFDELYDKEMGLVSFDKILAPRKTEDNPFSKYPQKNTLQNPSGQSSRRQKLSISQSPSGSVSSSSSDETRDKSQSQLKKNIKEILREEIKKKGYSNLKEFFRGPASKLKISGESGPPYFPILILLILLFIISVSIYRNSKKIETVADVTEERISKLEEDPPTPAKIVIVESETESDNSTKMIFLATFLGGILYFLYKKQ